MMNLVLRIPLESPGAAQSGSGVRSVTNMMMKMSMKAFATGVRIWLGQDLHTTFARF